MEQRKSREIAMPDARPTVGSRRTAMRVMNRKSCGMLAVYEQDPTTPDAGTRALVFETPTALTRVAKFPAEWHRLSDDELAAIRRSG